MAQTWTKKLLSANASGVPVPIVATATAGTAIHTGTAAKLQQVSLLASNIHTADVELTLEIGGTAAGNQQKHTIPPKQTIELPTLLIYGAVAIAGFADNASKINITGQVNEIA